MKVVYRSFDGRYSDNPRAVYDALLARGDAVEHVWMCKPGHANEFPQLTSTIGVEGDEAVKALESADLIVSNKNWSLTGTRARG